MPRYKKGIRNNCFHQNYTHDVLFPGATFRTRHNGECAILGRSDDKSRRGYYVVEFKTVASSRKPMARILKLVLYQTKLFHHRRKNDESY